MQNEPIEIMENKTSEILFKILWIGLVLTTIYVFGWMTFGYMTFRNIFAEKFTTWNLLFPNILTIGLLIIYTKEILIGYKPESKNRNLKSLLFFSMVIITLTLFQIPQFELIFNDLDSEYWQIILSLLIILTSYIGLLLNRLLKIKKFESE